MGCLLRLYCGQVFWHFQTKSTEKHYGNLYEQCKIKQCSFRILQDPLLLLVEQLIVNYQKIVYEQSKKTCQIMIPCPEIDTVNLETVASFKKPREPYGILFFSYKHPSVKVFSEYAVTISGWKRIGNFI